jgi:acetyl-CoA carboxylase carboxyltransferase component
VAAEPVDPVDDLRGRARAIREDMGGAPRVAALHEEGRLTARERIDLLIDEGSLSEVGTFARSIRPEDAGKTPGDGKIGGFARVGGRTVVVVSDDVTVKRASSSTVGGRKLKRLFEAGITEGVPIVLFGETGGARIPDMMGSEGFASIHPLVYPCLRARKVPFATVITGESFGASSFFAVVSDLVVQVRGSCLAVSSARVISAATGETITSEELGGVDVHARITGQIDLIAETELQACELVARFLSYLPSNFSQAPPRNLRFEEPEGAEDVGSVVPGERRRAYDMRKVIRRVVDRDSWFELGPLYGRTLLTGLARIGGHPVGVLASQPLQQAGILTPQACDKATRLITLCDAFGLPLIFLHDTPGFMIGRQVEHERLLSKSMLFKQAVVLTEVPKLAVILRKSFGLANHVMAGVGMDSDLLVAWPGAEISFMDPSPAANVVGSTADASALERVAADVSPYGAAGVMAVDEIIEPSTTRAVLSAALDRAASRPRSGPRERPLASWPMCW